MVVENHIIEQNKTDLLRRGFLFACTNLSESECLNERIFGTEKFYGPVVIRIRKGDIIFLHNLDTDVLFGAFKAVSDGDVDINPSSFGGRYRYQVKVEPIGQTIRVENAKAILNKYEFTRTRPLFREKLVSFLDKLKFEFQRCEFADGKPLSSGILDDLIGDIRSSKAKVDIEDDLLLIESTTLWDFPTQSYGLTPKGNNKYAGVTPAFIVEMAR